MQTILNKKLNIDPTTEPLFLGEALSLQRYDKFRYPVFFDLYSKQMEFNWRPEEKALGLDRVHYQTLSPHEKFIFTSNLKYQTLMDSVIARGIGTLSDYISNLELEACCTEWSRFETLHSYSYTYIVKNVYADPGEVFDNILNDEEIMKRANTVARDYDLLAHCADDPKAQIYLTLISINILEAIRFYVSFACSFAFAENKKMVGNADIIKLIQRDENLHLQITQNLLKILRDNPDEGFQKTVVEQEAKAVEMFYEAVEEEKMWAKYLFKDGSILGLNEELLCQYIEYLATVRMKAIGLPTKYNVKKNPLGWLRSWQDSGAVQEAPQEIEKTTYKIGASTNDIADMKMEDFGL